MNEDIESILRKLEKLVRDGGVESVEQDTVELKSVPADGGSWQEITKTVNAFLNTRGGVLILGIKETPKDQWSRGGRYKFIGWNENCENNLKELAAKKFADTDDKPLDLTESFPGLVVRRFFDGQIALQFVNELPADRKYVFLRVDGKYVTRGSIGYKRVGTGDVQLKASEIEIQREYQEEASSARELRAVAGTSIETINLDLLNDFIARLSSSSLTKLESLKPTLEAARSFLERKSFLRDGQVTLLGMLICGKDIADHLEYRCQVHGYVDGPNNTLIDKQNLIDNVLPLIEASNAYVLRNIHVGVGIERGGVSKPQYPEKLIRETVNNSIAHRDYSVNKQNVIVIKPNESLSIKNPGAFRRHLLIEERDGTRHIRRIIPEAKPRNPKLAFALRAYDKWEGRGIGMATMVNYCLENTIDLPYYKLGTEDVELVLRPGQLLGDRMDRYFRSFGGYLKEKLGVEPNHAQKLVLAYLIKSHWDNALHRYTILLSPDNNHSEELVGLERAGLVRELPREGVPPVYVVDPVLTDLDYTSALREIFGGWLDALNEDEKRILAVVYRHNRFGEEKARYPSAKDTSFALWYDQEGHSTDDIRRFDIFYRKVRKWFNKLSENELLLNRGKAKFPKYELNAHFLESRLKLD